MKNNEVIQTDCMCPRRHKKSKKEHRANREFSNTTKKRKLFEVGSKCEKCHLELTYPQANFHHIMSLSYAFHCFPYLPAEILRSIENCQVLCEECHVEIHKNDSLAVYSAIAANLLELLKTWEKPESHRTTARRDKKRIRQEKQDRAALIAQKSGSQNQNRRLP